MKKSKGPKILLIFAVCLLLFVWIVLSLSKPSTPNYEFSDSENLQLELSSHNDSAAVDEIYYKVKEDLTKNDTKESEQIINDGLFFIKENVNDLTKDNVTMEKAMYYGCYISEYIKSNYGDAKINEFAEKDRLVYELGSQTYSYIKYPYRNEEGSSNKLEKIKECLNELQK